MSIELLDYQEEAMKLKAENDETLLENAYDNAKKLIEQYINKIGNETGKKYTIE